MENIFNNVRYVPQLAEIISFVYCCISIYCCFNKYPLICLFYFSQRKEHKKLLFNGKGKKTAL